MSYTSLHCHSDYSNIRMLDSINQLPLLFERARELKLKGLAITDHETLSGHIKAIQYVKQQREKYKNKYEAEENEEKKKVIKQELDYWNNFKLILGNEIYLTRNDLRLDNYIKGKDKYYHFILLAKDAEGHKQLRELSSRAWSHSFRQFIERVPTFYRDIEEIIGANPGHVIGSTACLGSQFAHLIREFLDSGYSKEVTKRIDNFVKWCQKQFGKENFFIELQSSESDDQNSYNKCALAYAKSRGIKVIITTDAHYLRKEDRPIHKSYLNSSEGDRETDAFYSGTYLQDADQIKEYMNNISSEDIDIMLENTNYINSQIEEYDLKHKEIVPKIKLEFKEVRIDDYDIIRHIVKKCNLEYIDKFVNSQSEQDKCYINNIFYGLSKKIDLNNWEEYLIQIEKEVAEVYEITQKIGNDLSSYFNTMAKVVDIMWNEGDSLVGISRGSAGGFVSNYLLGITQMDPIKYGIENMYWRFIHRDRPELPDVDTDFQASKRPKVTSALKDYFESIGGEVYNIATFGTETSKAALQTAARGLGYDSDLGIYISSLVPIDRGKVRTLNQCYYGDEEKGFNPIPQFIKSMNEYPDIWEVAQKVEGTICRRGLHACFDGNTLVVTENGYKPIKDIKKGEKVLTHNNRYKTVLDTIKTDWNETYTIRAVGTKYINTTATHPFLVRSKIKDIYKTVNGQVKRIHCFTEPEWKEVKNLEIKKDYLGIPINTKNELPTLKINLEYSDINFWWLIGRYIGDGWTENRIHNDKYEEHQIIICCDKSIIKNEKEDIIMRLNLLNYEYRIEEATTTYKIYIKKDGLWEFLQLFGKYANNKFIPNFVINLPCRLLQSFFDGYISADGYIKQSKITFKTVSEKLLLGISQIVNKIYHKTVAITIIAPRQQRILGRLIDCKTCYQGQVNLNPRYERAFYDNNYIWTPIKEIVINEEKKKMYNLSVNEDNSYIVENVAVHNCGMLIVNESFCEHNAVMKAPNGTLCSQFELHDSEYMGGVKFDALTTDALDRIRTCLDLLLKYGYIEWQDNLRDTYNKYVGLENLDYDTEEMWKEIGENKISNLFQYDTPVGLATAKLVKPKSAMELAVANSLMRLMAQDGGEMPSDTYTRYKNNIELWYREMEKYGLTEEEIKIMEGHLLNNYGVCDSQEGIMLISMDEKISGFSVKEANKLRKTIAKKKLAEIDNMHKLFMDRGREHGTSNNLLNYVWEVQVKRQLGYSFSLIHSLAYSLIAIQEMNLAYHYPTVFWNCSNLIVDSAGIDENDEFVNLIDSFDPVTEIVEEDNSDEDDEEDMTKEEKEEIKKQNKTVDYGKIASAIGKMMAQGIKVELPDINKSEFTFTPDIENNSIIFGIKGINRVNNDLAKDIIINRPYTGLKDFLSKVKSNKIAIINLIKAGCFDKVEKRSRKDIMIDYIDSISDKKQRLTLQNMAMLIRENCIPSEYKREVQIYNFNKYLKNFKKDIYYLFDDRAFTFYEKMFDMDLVSQNEEGQFMIKQREWDKIYKKEMTDIREELKTNPKILEDLNKKLFDSVWNKYADGNISKWEMDSVCFYYDKHELADIDKERYYIEDYFDLPEEPEVDNIWKTKEGKEIPIFKLTRICGTVIDKNKMKNIVTLLTENGVVNLKIYRAQFSKYDKQISVKDSVTGKKTIIERSWFKRGNKLMVAGIRRGDNFVPKIYKNNAYFTYPIELITSIDENGIVTVAGERAE